MKLLRMRFVHRTTRNMTDDVTSNGGILHLRLDTDTLVSCGFVNETYFTEVTSELSQNRSLQVFLEAYSAVHCYHQTDHFIRRELPKHEALSVDMEGFIDRVTHHLDSNPIIPEVDLYAFIVSLCNLYNALMDSMDILEWSWNLLYDEIAEFDAALNTAHKLQGKENCDVQVETISWKSERLKRLCNQILGVFVGFRETKLKYHEFKCYILSLYIHN